MSNDPKKEPSDAPRGIVLSGTGAVTAAGTIGVTHGVALSGAAAFSAAGETKLRQRHITRIKIRKLFGHLNYNIPDENYDSTHEDLLIIYGDNGSGKTTILTMLFNLLSTTPGRGYKTYLSKTPFQKFEIEFNGGSRVVVEKEPGQLIGGYTVAVSEQDGRPKTFTFKVGPDHILRAEGNPFDDLSTSLTGLGVSLYFLPDDRRVKADFSDETTHDIRLHRYYHDYLFRDQLLRRSIALSPSSLDWSSPALSVSEPTESHHLEIAPVLQALAGSLSRQTIQGSNTGEENASSIYLRVVKGLQGVQTGTDTRTSPGDDLIDRLRTLDRKIHQFSRFGLLPNFPAELFIDAFSEATSEAQLLIRDVLEPYLEGLEARLGALQELYDIVSTYVETLNSFFSNKKIDLNIQRGITFTSQWGESIEPNLLSSGERQLLLLLSNTILARKRSSIFIIDEPELSLNVKWQRQLVDALLRCSLDGGIQYILASHSLELITQYQSRTVRLVSTDI